MAFCEVISRILSFHHSFHFLEFVAPLGPIMIPRAILQKQRLLFIDPIMLDFNIIFFLIDNQGCVYTDGCWNVVVLYFDHDFILHCQFGRFFDSREDGIPNRISRRFSQTKHNKIWLRRGWLYLNIFSCKKKLSNNSISSRVYLVC